MSAPVPLGRGRAALLGILSLAAFVVLLALGTWQVQRLQWKEALIARVEERIHAPPVALPPREGWGALAPEDYEFRRVSLRGRFRHDEELHVSIVLGSPRGAAGGIGYFVVTPMELEGPPADGTVVLVNRGFVPLDRKDPATRVDGQVEGVVDVTGLMRPPDAGNIFTPAADPAANVWFTRDPAEMAAAIGLPVDRVAPFTVDAEGVAPGGFPQGGETIVSFPNSHLAYAVTWYGLAFALAAVAIGFVVSRRKQQGR